jgi:hypothetical protein
MTWLRNLWARFRKSPAPLSVTPAPERGDGLRKALAKAKETAGRKSYCYPVKAPDLMPGVVKAGAKSGIALDSNFNAACSLPGAAGYAYGDSAGFPGYPYLAALATRAEYRAFASTLATERTREWIVLNSTDTAGESTKTKITELTQAIKDCKLQKVMRRAAEHDCLYGRGQIFIKIKGADDSLPLILDKRTVAKDSFIRVTNVEPIWTTPSAYNALDPSDPNFYKPSKWWMLGKEIHASRLMTMITREVPDILKPAFNFSGISLSQLAEPYVDNWLRTRQSVSDLINNFSITALKTSMQQVLQGGDGPACDGTDLFERADLFTAGRSNKGLMLLDKDSEELVQVNTPLGGLHELQAQAQEQMCSVSRTPAIILTGISPSGLNASSEGEIATFEDWIAVLQEAFDREPIETVLKVLQFSMYGEVDPDITFAFVPLRQMTKKELAEIRTADSTTDANYIDRGVVDPSEVREKIARDPDSGYQGLDMSLEIKVPSEGDTGDEDEDEK